MEGIITSGFLFPNEIHVKWSLMIVLYPYITGLVAGAFIVSSLYHVFGKTELKPIARFSLVAAFCFLLFACTPLLFHLGHPERAFNIMFTPKFTSAMSGFGYIYTFYLLLVLLEIWLVYRPDIVKAVMETTGIKKVFYWCLALGNLDVSEKTLTADKKLTYILAAVGIPSACILHGYVGFLFGSLKSNPWWSTPLMPVIFLLSAIVSGIAMLIVCYWLWMKFSGGKIDNNCMSSLYKYLWGFFILDFTLEFLEVLTHIYEAHEEWHIVSQMLSQKLWFSYYFVQMGVFAIVPLIGLGFASLMKISDRTRNMIGITCSVLLLFQVFAMRWNVVIGGQLFSKSLRGLTDYVPGFLDKEGILVALVIFAMPFVVMYLFGRVLPLWQKQQSS